MADVPVPPPPPPPPPPGDLLGNSSPQPAPISGGNATMTPSQSGTSLYSASGSSDAGSVGSAKSGLGKRPATIDEIRHSARKWSLAGDAGVLLYLQQFSQNMILKTHELEKVVDSLAYETKGLNSKVHNTFNDFLMLSNKQFIENRVYDEEVSQEETASKETPQQQNKTREQLEAEILPRFSQAVNLGFQVLEDAFITVELKPSEESDDEDEESLPAGYVPDPIIEPKDMYASRPLPHLIGSAEFFSDDLLGLVENDDEEEEGVKTKEEESDESETSESESESESQYSESSEETKSKPSRKEVLDDTESEVESESDEDLFGEAKKKPDFSLTDESEDEEVSQPKPKMAIKAELAAKLGLQGQSAKVSVSEDDKSDTQSIASKKSFADTKSISSNIDAEKVESGSKIEKEGKHMSSSKRSEGGHKKSKGSAKSHHHHQHHHKHKAVEEDLESDEDLFGDSKQKEEKIENDNPFGKKGGMFSGGGTLFGGDSEGDLFGEIEKEDTSSPREVEKPPEPETPSEIKPRTRTTSSGKKLPAGAVSLFGGANLFSNEEDSKEHTIIEEDPVRDKDVKDEDKDTKKPPPIVKGLFGDDDDDDDGGSLFDSKPKQANLQEPANQKRKKTLELFDDKDDGGDLFNDDKKPAAKSVTEPNKVEKKMPVEDAGGLFAASDKEKIETAPRPEGKKTAAKPNVLSLFDDDAEEEDWFDAIKPTQTPTNLPKDDKKAGNQKLNGPLFSDAQPIEAKTQLAKEKKPPKSKKVTLFDDDDDDLFGMPSSNKNTKDSSLKDKPALKEKEVEKAQKEAEPKMPPKEAVQKKKENKTSKEKKTDSLGVNTKTKSHKGRSFIDEYDNGLFGDDQDDLFTSPIKKPSAQAKESPEKKKPKASAISFLDDDEDDDDSDIFGAGSQSGKSQIVKSASEPNQIPTSEEKWKVEISKNAEGSKKAESMEPSDILGSVDDDDDDLFGSKNTQRKSDKKGSYLQPQEEIPKTTEASENLSPQQKPKKLPGAVSLFGGIDPFAAKKTLRSPSKEEAERPSDQEISEDDDPLSITKSNQQPKPAYSERTEQTRGPSRSSKIEEKESTLQKEETVGAQEESRNIPSIVFDPATLLPGATPPQRTFEPPPASFDDHPPLQTLTNPTKDRAKIQKKRRPPTRQLRQGLTSSEQSIASSIDGVGTIVDSTKSVGAKNPPASISEWKIDPEEKRISTEKTIDGVKILKVDDIFSDDDDDALFGSKKAQPAKQQEKKLNVSTEKNESKTPDIVDTTNKIKTEKIEANRPNTKLYNSDLFSDDRNDADDIFNIAKASPSKEESPKADSKSPKADSKSPKADSNISTLNESSYNEAKEELVNAETVKDYPPAQALNVKEANAKEVNAKEANTKEANAKEVNEKEATAKETNGEKDSEDEDLFKPSGKKERKAVAKDEDRVDGKVQGEEVNKVKKKKKEKASIFNEGVEDDLFSSATKKHEDKIVTTKKTKKASKTVTDEELFGDTGTIFDVPSKTKEKRKKKSETGKDIFSSKDDDIFAKGSTSEKKVKTKKKTEKTERKTTGKASKNQVTESDKKPDIFEDPLNALGGD